MGNGNVGEVEWGISHAKNISMKCLALLER